MWQLHMKILHAANLPVETWDRFGPFEIEAPLSEGIRGTKLMGFTASML